MGQGWNPEAKLRPSDRPLLNGLFRQNGLLAEAIRNLRQIPVIGTDRGQIIQLADKIKCTQRFPHLLGARVDSSHFGPCC